MKTKAHIKILPQPTDESCGPTCLHAVYSYYGDKMDLSDLIKDVKTLKDGGTLAVMLGNHALKRNYKACIYTYNLHVFDPSWFSKDIDISEKLKEQLFYKNSKKLRQATKAYLQFLEMGGEIRFEELRPSLIKRILSEGKPILSGLSATYLYNSQREIGELNVYHDTKGEPSGHFVVISDYDHLTKKCRIADPLNPNPIKDSVQYYRIDVQRVINSILLGIVTYDANLLVIEP
ncbi:C39 family peptidase [Hyphobacterium sp. CCMP332]|nr:C39 family peptidase [Hyphobacterium sp. CCMP332]